MLGRKAVDFISKDTGGKNESKTVIVILRIMMLSIGAYCLLSMFLGGVVFGSRDVFAFYGILPVVFLVLFFLSYHLRKTFVLWCFNGCIILWVCAVVYGLGWNVGVQHFLIVLLVLYFFSDYRHHTGKILFAVALSVFRILLFFLYHQAEAVWALESGAENAMQILSTVTIFWCISVIAFICSEDGQKLEGKLVEYNYELEEQANTDTLTGLYNRRKAMKCLDRIAGNPDVYGDFCLCICDIDYFKKVNDNYGHDCGDEVLRCIGALFKREMQGQGIAARWGGEEFLLVFVDCNGDEAYIKLEQLQRKINALQVIRGDDTVSVTMTFGLAEYNFHQGLESTVKEADEKLYLGKERGRNTIIF